jgi:hypothetical protein
MSGIEEKTAMNQVADFLQQPIDHPELRAASYASIPVVLGTIGVTLTVANFETPALINHNLHLHKSEEAAATATQIGQARKTLAAAGATNLNEVDGIHAQFAVTASREQQLAGDYSALPQEALIPLSGLLAFFAIRKSLHMFVNRYSGKK